MKVQASKIDANYVRKIKVIALDPGLYIQGDKTWLKLGRKGSEGSILFDCSEHDYWLDDMWIPDGLQFAPAGHELKFTQD